MENDEMDDQEALNPDEGQDSNLDESETIEEMQARLKKAEELARNYKVRAEKAEAAAKKPKETPPKGESETETPKKGVNVEDLPLEDINALAGMHKDDARKLIRWAKFNEMSVADAKETKEWKAINQIDVEERASAAAANTSSARKSTNHADDSQILRQVDEGTLPEDKMREAAQARIRQWREKNSS